MDAETRRERIWKRLREENGPISASTLASTMEVSRQVVVGDIALLRAQGCAITATTRGYTMTPSLSAGRFIGKLACQHSAADTETELMVVVQQGGTVLDIIVEHDLYGELIGQLNISSEQDVKAFVQRVQRNETRLLSELTGGVHLHTVSCRDAAAFEAIKGELTRVGLLYNGSLPPAAKGDF